MTDISVRQVHRLSPDSAKAAARKMADRMAAEYDMAADWDGNKLNFKRSGLSGTLVLHEKKVQLDVTLGALLAIFAVSIEEKIVQQMNKVFSEKA